MLAMENCKFVANAVNNIAALHLSGTIDKGQWGKSCDGLLSGRRSYHADSPGK
jgi:hypothetical protein